MILNRDVNALAPFTTLFVFFFKQKTAYEMVSQEQPQLILRPAEDIIAVADRGAELVAGQGRVAPRPLEARSHGPRDVEINRADVFKRGRGRGRVGIAPIGAAGEQPDGPVVRRGIRLGRDAGARIVVELPARYEPLHGHEILEDRVAPGGRERTSGHLEGELAEAIRLHPSIE